MPSTSCARYRSKNSVTTPAAACAVRARVSAMVIGGCPFSCGRAASCDRDLVEALDGQPPVELALAPVGEHAGEPAAVDGEPPGLVDVEVLFLVDGAGVVGGLGALGLE